MVQPRSQVPPLSVEGAFQVDRTALGFRVGPSGGLLSRTMMLRELEAVIAQTPPDATLDAIRTAVIEGNILGKPTLASRNKSYRHLQELYGLDASTALFRLLRKLSAIDAASLPAIALTIVFCRDPQLRSSFALIRTLKPGELLSRHRMEDHLEAAFPARFSAVVKRALAQNVNASWTSAGHLRGRVKKIRTLPTPRPVAVAYAMVAGYLAGLRGQRLLHSEFGELVAGQPGIIAPQLSLASARGLLRFKHAGGVVEFDFTALLTARERTLSDVTD